MISADLTGLGAYIGTVDGILDAIADPRFEGDFLGHVMGEVKTHFMTETIAMHQGNPMRLQHVFEWGGQDESGIATGTPSNIPLFKLTRKGSASGQSLGYIFLPSTKYVPLPDPERYGFSPDKLQHMRRHTFQLKALIMETQANVNISPMGAKRLFIPSETAKRGYVLTNKTVSVNPGGRQATGGFAQWWNQWFEMRAQEIVTTESVRTEKFLTVTGHKYVRYAAGTVIGGQKVGGRFATGKTVSASYVNAKAEEVKRKVLAESEKFFDEDAYWATWED